MRIPSPEYCVKFCRDLADGISPIQKKTGKNPSKQCKIIAILSLFCQLNIIHLVSEDETRFVTQEPSPPMLSLSRWHPLASNIIVDV